MRKPRTDTVKHNLIPYVSLNLQNICIFFIYNFFSSLISASIYTERFMGLPIKSDNLEHYKVRILFLS